MLDASETADLFGGKTDDELVREELEYRRRSARRFSSRWKQHPLNPASDASIRVFRTLAILLALTLMAFFLLQAIFSKTDRGGWAIAASSTTVALSIAVGARSR